MKKNDTWLMVFLVLCFLVLLVDVAMPFLTGWFPWIGGAVEAGVNTATEALQATLVSLIVVVLKK